MSEDQQQFGEGQDNYLQGARKATEAAKQFGGGAAHAAGEATAL